MKTHYSLVIVGSGFKARWMAFKAYQNGIRDFVLVLDTTAIPCQSHVSYRSGLLKTFPWDFVTRSVVAHGAIFTKQYRSFVKEEIFKVKKEFDYLFPTKVEPCSFLRYISSLHEWNEFVEHSDLLGNKIRKEGMDEIFKKSLGISMEEEHEAFLFDLNSCEEYLDSLLLKLKIPIITRKIRSSPLNSSKCLNFSDSSYLNFDALILMEPSDIRIFYPSMKDVLVLYRESFLEFDIHMDSKLHKEKNFFILSKYANNYFLKQNNKLFSGGFRYLAADFGIENFTEKVSEKWIKHAEEQTQKICSISREDIASCQVGFQIGCLPCDELPIVGPMFGDQGVFICTGFSQLDLSLSLAFTQPLLDLIVGVSSSIHRRLYPERHRDLRDQTN